jgi:hypothetical protein
MLAPSARPIDPSTRERILSHEAERVADFAKLGIPSIAWAGCVWARGCSGALLEIPRGYDTFFRAYSYYNRTGGNDDDERPINGHTAAHPAAASELCINGFVGSPAEAGGRRAPPRRRRHKGRAPARGSGVWVRHGVYGIRYCCRTRSASSRLRTQRRALLSRSRTRPVHNSRNRRRFRNRRPPEHTDLQQEVIYLTLYRAYTGRI